MMPKPSTPPLSILGATLRSVTERLAFELSRPTGESPDWNDTEWRISIAAMALQGTSAPLAALLSWQGPSYWHRHLEKQRSHVALRSERVEQILEQLDATARRENAPMVALKGSALYRTRVYRNRERCLGDIDLLVDPADLAAATRAIVDCGYRQSVVMTRHIVFEPVGEHAPATFDEDIGNPLKIELHTHIAEPLPRNEVDITASIFPRHRRPGINDYASRAALMRHLLLHAAGNMRARALRQIQLHDIALLAREMTNEDWIELSVSNEQRGIWWALAPLALTARYYQGVIPESIVAAAIEHCPSWLRRVTAHQQLTDVSWSNIRIEAFPGIEWSKSPLEALLFARGRVMPRPADRSMLEYAVTVLPWAAQIPWYGQSHLTRIFRWIFTRPPRVQTLYSIQAALAREF